MPDSITLSSPDPGSTVTTSPTFSGSYSLANTGSFNKIVVRIVYPPNTMNTNLVVEGNATNNATALTWTLTFAGVPVGLDTTVTAELYIGTTTAVLADSDTIEDVDILDTTPVGTLGTITRLPTPIIPIP